MIPLNVCLLAFALQKITKVVISLLEPPSSEHLKVPECSAVFTGVCFLMLGFFPPEMFASHGDGLGVQQTRSVSPSTPAPLQGRELAGASVTREAVRAAHSNQQQEQRKAPLLGSVNY